MDCCTGGELLLPLKSKITLAAFFSNGKLTDAYLDSLSGTMCGRSTVSPGEALSMSLAEDSHAKTLAALEKEQESKDPGAASGVKWRELSVKYDRATSSWKTHQCLWEEVLPWSSVILPRWGMMRSGVLSERMTPALPTSGTGYGSSENWPTPRAGKTTDENEETWQKRKDAGKVCTPPLTLAVKMWPTHGSAKAGNDVTLTCSGDGRQKPNKLGWAVAQTFATPQARDFRTGGADRWDNPARSRNLNDQVARLAMWPTPHGFSPDGKSNGPSGNELGRAVNRSIPTPTASMMTLEDMEQARFAGNKGSNRPAYGAFPTPRAEDSQCAGGHRGKDDTLYGAICRPKQATTHEYGTPRSSDANGSGPIGSGPIGSRSHAHMLEKGYLCAQTATVETGGSLNPDWVEALMGWPVGWSDITKPCKLEFRGWGEGWEDGIPRVAVGVPHRVDRLKAIGNGQVPLCAAMAWLILGPENNESKERKAV